MNIPKKLYCRCFQTVLRSMLPVLPYRDPELLSSLAALIDILHKHEIRSVLLVTDAGVRSCGLTQPLEHLLDAEGIHCAVYDRTVANPTDENVEQARALYLAENCNALIGFGGGSSIDCAKAVGARIVKPKQPLHRMAGILRVRRRLPLLIAVPTTAGTGSEATLAAVITDSRSHRKYPISDFPLIPHYAVLDPKITYSLPPHMTACTAMDALTHAVEAYIGRSTTRETRADALEAVRLIFANLDRAYQNGCDKDARAALLHASFLAGRSFSRSYVGYVHAVAHSLSGKYGLAHGYTNAILLPKVLAAYGPCIHKKLAVLAKEAGVAQQSESSCVAAHAFIDAIAAMNRRFGLPETLKELKVQDIPELARIADQEGNPLYPVPVLMDDRQLRTLFESVLEEPYEKRRNQKTDRGTESILCRRQNDSGGVPDTIAQAS